MATTKARRRYRFSEARAQLSTLVDDAEKGIVSVVNRRGSRPVVVVDLFREAELLARAFPFAPQVVPSEEGEGVWIWVPELAVGGEGEDLAEAEQATVAAVLDYAAAWCDGLGEAPNHAHRWGWVVRVQLADTPEGVHQLLFADETVLFADESVSPEPHGHQIHTLDPLAAAAAIAQPINGQLPWRAGAVAAVGALDELALLRAGGTNGRLLDGLALLRAGGTNGRLLDVGALNELASLRVGARTGD